LRAAIALLVTALGGDPEASKWETDVILPSDKIAVKRPDRATLVALAASIGVKHDAMTDRLDEDSDWLDFAAHLKLTASQCDDRLWYLIRQQLIDSLRGEMNIGFDDGTGIALLAAALDADWKGMVAKAQDAMPLAKTLAAFFNEDGTARENLKGSKAEKAKTEEIVKPKGKEKAKPATKMKAKAKKKSKA
jgi:hypothetical protein